MLEKKPTSKAAGQATVDSSDLFHLAVESAPNAIVITNDDGKIILVNSETCRLFGYESDELVGKSIEILVPERFRRQHPHFRAEFFRNPETRAMGAGRDLFGLRRDGSEFPVEIGLNPIQTANEWVVLSAIIDITERKQSEQRLNILLNTLRDKNKELEELIYVASHDLRSPLINIQGFSKELDLTCKDLQEQLASLEIPGEVKERLSQTIEGGIKDALNFIVTSAVRMDALLNGLLKLSRLGQAAFDIQKLDMVELLKTLKKTFEFQMHEAGVDLLVGEIAPCYGDENQITQVFSNLISNAIKYRSPKRAGKIHISSERKDDSICYCVEDNGIGIPETYQQKIFEIFHRLEANGEPGEGLGLNIVQRIVDKHGGRIWLTSKPNIGSKFYVALPARPFEPAIFK